MVGSGLIATSGSETRAVLAVVKLGHEAAGDAAATTDSGRTDQSTDQERYPREYESANLA